MQSLGRDIQKGFCALPKVIGWQFLLKANEIRALPSSYLMCTHEGISELFPEAYNVLCLIQNLNLEQTISFMTANCTRGLRSEESRVNAVKLKKSEAKPHKKYSHCRQAGHTEKYCYDLHPELWKSRGVSDVSTVSTMGFPVL